MKTENNNNEFLDAEEFVASEPNFSTEEQFDDGDNAPDTVADDEMEKAVNPAEVSEGTDWKDKYMRLSAEFDNYRKRTLKEKMDLISTGGEDIVKAILPVMDDMDRAIEGMDKSDDIDSARKGMHLIQQKLIETLRQKGVCEILANGEELDTDLHEAIAKFPSDNQKGRVVDTVQKGYKMKDKVIRFCKVVVGE